MNKKEKKERLGRIADRLWEVYPKSECALKYNGDGWRLLVMARLSAQCTDARVNIVSEELFRVFPTAQAMAEGELSEIERIVRPCGLYRTKAQSIKAASAMLIRDFGGELPDDMERLLTLPGVGRKIANLLLGDIFGKPAVVCDTHCIRICGRLGMYPESEKNPERVERALRELLDLERGSGFCHRIVDLGREYCTARAPKCDVCPIAELCQKRAKECAKKLHGVGI